MKARAKVIKRVSKSTEQLPMVAKPASLLGHHSCSFCLQSRCPVAAVSGMGNTSAALVLAMLARRSSAPTPSASWDARNARSRYWSASYRYTPSAVPELAMPDQQNLARIPSASSVSRSVRSTYPGLLQTVNSGLENKSHAMLLNSCGCV